MAGGVYVWGAGVAPGGVLVLVVGGVCGVVRRVRAGRGTRKAGTEVAPTAGGSRATSFTFAARGSPPATLSSARPS